MKNAFYRIIAMLLVVALCASLLPAAVATEAPTATFKDVGPTHWAYEYVERAAADGLFQGVDDDTFEPDTTMDRAMFVTVLSRLAGASVDNTATSDFTDIPANQWYTGAVAWAAELGITTGATETTFEPFQGVTRQQAATFLYRYAMIAGVILPEGTAPAFTDAEDIDAYALEAMEALAMAGILTGYTDGSAKPDNILIRAEAAALFVRFAELAKAPKETYGVTFMAPHVTVTVDGTATTFCAVEEGSDLSFTLEAEEGYTITSVSTDKEILTADEKGTYVLENISGDTAITVLAESTAPATVCITFAAENATVYVDGEAVTEAFAEGELTFTAEAAEGYEIYSVTAEAGTLTDNGDGTYTLSGLTEATTVYVVATEKAGETPEPETYTITFVTDEGVEVYVNGEAAETATVTAEELPFTFGVSMVEEHTRVAAAEASPAGNLFFTGEAYVLTGITGDTTVTLTTGPELLDVAFYTPTGATAVETVQVPYGECLELPEDPSMEGYFFGGWFTDKDLYYTFSAEQPITEDMVLFGGFGRVVEVVHFDSIEGSNDNDGATKETSVISMAWALKLAEHSTTKSIIMHYAAPVITDVTEVWDASHIEGGITVYMDPDTYTQQGTWAIYTTTGNLTVKNMHFICEGATEYKGACFLYNYSAYDQATESYSYGNTTLIDCTVTGFGNCPHPEDTTAGFFNDVIYNLGTLTMIGGEYYGNSSPSGVVNNYHGYANFYADGVYFHDNRAPYCSNSIYGKYGGGALWVNCWVAEIKNCVFENNWASIGGGAIAFSTITELPIENCTFIGNTTDGNGGAILGYNNHILSLGEGNVFKDNKASGMGGAIYANTDLTVTDGIFEGNTGNKGNDIYGAKSVTLAPAEGSELVMTGGLTVNGGLKISATLANLEKNLVIAPTAVAAGTIIASGVDYTLTEADMAKLTVVPTVELVLDTERNTIKVKELGGGDVPTGPVEDEMEGPHNLSVVYLGAGSDSNDGTSAAQCVATFGKAKSLLAPNGIIYICGQVTLTGDKMWSLDPEEFGTAKLMRAPNYNGQCVSVRGNLTLHDIVFDGGNNNATTYLMGGNGSGVTITLGEGCVIQNARSSGYYAAVAYGSGGDTVIIDGAKITNGYSSGYYAGMIYAPTVVMKAGEISNCTRSGYYGGAALGGKSISVLGGEIYGISSSDAYGAVIFAASSGNVTINGGKIHDNSAAYIVGHMGNAPMEIDGGEFYKNNASKSVIGTAYTGGNILLGATKIYNNTSSDATIKIPGSCTMTVMGAEITGNTARGNGGAISASSSNTYLKLQSGKLSGNTSNGYGDEIYVANQKTLTIAPSSAGLEIGGEIYLNASSFTSDGNTVGDLTNLKDTLQFNFSKLSSGIVVASPEQGYTFTEADLAKFDSFGCEMGYQINAAGKIVTKAIGLESVSLDKTEITIMASETAKLIASIGPANASATDLVWKSSNTAVAKISGSQLQATVTGVAPGTAIITASAADNSAVYAECVVTVTENTTPVASLKLNKTTHTMRVEQSVSLSATIAPSNAGNQTLEWTISDPTIATLTANGKSATIKALAIGEVTVTATTTDGTNLSASCVITIDPRVEIESITLNKTEHRMDDGESVSLTATVTPSDAWNTTVTWTSSNTAVATVTATGKTVTVRAIADGTAIITATTADGKTATCAITVADTPVSGLYIETETDVVRVGNTIGLTANVSPSNAANKNVTWKSSDESIATVHVYGSDAVVYGIAPGEVTITATSEDGGFTDSIIITVEELSENMMELDLTELDLIVYQSFNITATFEQMGLDVTWTTSNEDIVSILSTNNNQVTIKCGGIAGAAIITATASDGQTATCAINVEGRISGTLDEVYVHSDGNDSNDGSSPETAVRSLERGIELLGVDGIIYVSGKSVSLRANANITLPKEIYGDAKIVMVHTHEEWEEENPWGGVEIRKEDYAPTFLAKEGVMFSDVTISWEQGGTANNILGGATLNVIISNGARLLGCNGKDGASQSLAYIYGDSKILVNGGEISGFGNSRVIWVRERGQVTVNGGIFKNNSASYILTVDGSSAKGVVNGGYFESAKTVLYATSSDVQLNGGTYIGLSTSGTLSTNNALAYSYQAYLTINPKYGMKVENYGVYHYNDYCETYLGSLHNLEGSLGFNIVARYAYSGTPCFYGMYDHTLTCEDLAKVYMSGKALEIDPWMNCICIK